MKKYFFLLFIILTLKGFCGDTLKLKQTKNIIDLSYGNAVFLGHRDILYQMTLYSNDNFKVNTLQNVSLNYSRLINSSIKDWYISSGINYMFFNLTKQISSNNYNKFAISTYEPNSFKYRIQSLSFSVHLEYLHYFKKICFTQALGINFTGFLNTKSVQYTETTTSSYPYQDPSLASPSNPYGWAWNNSTTTTLQNDKLYNFENYFTPVYTVGFGYKIKKFVPFIKGEFSLFNMDIKSPILKYQAGIKFLF